QHNLKINQRGFESEESVVEISSGAQSLIEVELRPHIGRQPINPPTPSGGSGRGGYSTKALVGVVALASVLIAGLVYYLWPTGPGKENSSSSSKPQNSTPTPTPPKVEARLEGLPNNAVIEKALPNYPAEAHLQNVQEVPVYIVVSSDGRVIHATE